MARWGLTAALSGMKRSPSAKTSRDAIVVAWPGLARVNRHARYEGSESV